jgi:hypothetical protein
MTSTSLVIIFNHRFDRNLPVLRELYRDRFDKLLFLVPFYDGPDKDVVPVHYGSHEFGGFVFNAQEYLKEADTDYYAFAGDDLILRPDFDRDVERHLKLKPQEGYIKRLVPMTQLSYTWPHTLSAMEVLYAGAFNWREFLPPSDEFIAKYKKMGIDYPPFSSANLRPYRKPRDFHEVRRWARRVWMYYRRPERRHPALPLLESYADFFVVPRPALERFAFLNGIFAASKIHAELAVPTALAMSCNEVVTEEQLNESGLELWRSWDREAIEDRYQKDLNCLLDDFPEKTLYIHPVKLSGWKYNPSL